MYKLSNFFDYLKIKWLFLFLCFFVVIFFCTYTFIKQERYIYYWDYSTYHTIINDIIDRNASGEFSFFWELQKSIQYYDHTLLPVYPFVPFVYFFGNSRIIYILLIVILYAFPAMALFSIVQRKIFSRKLSIVNFCIPLLVFMLTPLLWEPILRGYLDIVALLPIFSVLYICKLPLYKNDYFKILLIGILLSITMFLRRYFAYWIVGYLFYFFLEFILISLTSLREKKYKIVIKELTATFFLCFSVAVICWFVGGKALFERFTKDYAEVYSAYKFQISIMHEVLQFINDIGLGFFLLLILGVIQVAFKKSISIYKKISLLTITIIPYLLFIRVQSMDVHHYSIVLPSVLIYVTEFIVYISTHRIRILKYLGAISIIFLILNSFVVFSMLPEPKHLQYLDTLSKRKVIPFKRNDIDSIKNLLNQLNILLEQKKGGIYVLSSSGVLNQDIMKNSCLMYEYSDNLCNALLRTHDVDKRDKFPFHFFEAEYIVIPDPVQYHLDATNQQTIIELKKEIENTEELGKYYNKAEEKFVLDNNVIVNIYIRNMLPFPENVITDVIHAVGF